MNVVEFENDAAAKKEKKRQAIMNNASLNVWQKKHMLDELDRTYGGGKSGSLAGSSNDQTGEGWTRPRGAVTNPFTYLNQNHNMNDLARFKAKFDNNPTREEWTALQLQKQNDSIDAMPGWGKQMVSGFAGAADSVSMGLIDATTRNKAASWDTTAASVQNGMNRMRNEAPLAYGIGEVAGSFIPVYGVEGAVVKPLSRIYNPFIRDTVTGAASYALPAMFADINRGKPAGEVVGNALSNAGIGALGGAAARTLGDTVLPMAGTIDYQKMLDRGGLGRKLLASTVNGLARLLNPRAADALDEFRLGSEGVLQPNDIARYDYFKKVSIPYDDLEGHEIWQHSNLKSKGLATERQSSAASRENPVVVLDKSVHARISRLQREFSAMDQAPIDNINTNYKLLIDQGIPDDNASWAKAWAIHQMNKYTED